MTVTEAELLRREAAAASLRATKKIEESHLAVNAPLIQADWLQKLRECKRIELLAEAMDIEAAQKARNARQAQALRASASSLETLQQEIEAARAAHRSTLASLLQLNTERLENVADRHAQSLNQLAAEVVKEEHAASEAHQALLATLAEDVSSMQTAHNSTQKAMETAFLARKRELIESWDERAGVTRLLGEERVASLLQELREVKESATTATKEDRLRYKQLADDDSKDTEAIQNRRKELKEVQNEIALWQERLAKDAEIWAQQVSEATSAKGEALQEYTEAQKNLGMQRKRHEKKLKTVSLASGAVEDELEDIVSTAERVLKGLELKRGQLERQGHAATKH